MAVNKFSPGCGCNCGGSTSCAGTLTVSTSSNCSTTPTGEVVSLTYGTTTTTLSAPNSGANYLFTSTTSSGWSAGTAGTITVTSGNHVTAIRSVTLACANTTKAITLTRNYMLVNVGGCNGTPDPCLVASVSAVQGGHGFGPVTSHADCTYEPIPINVEDDGTGYTLSATAPGWMPQVQSGSGCSNTILMTTPDASHVCCASTRPTCLTMTMTCSLGTVTLTYDLSQNEYLGQITATVMGYPATGFAPFLSTTANPFCTNAMTNVSVTFYFAFSCAVLGTPTMFVRYNGCRPSGGNSRAYEDGAANMGGTYNYGGSTTTSSGTSFSTTMTPSAYSPGFVASGPAASTESYCGGFTVSEIAC